MKSLVVAFVIFISSKSFATVTDKYCDENNLRQSIAEHIFGSPEILKLNADFASYGLIGIKSLGLEVSSTRSALNWINIKVIFCEEQSPSWGSAEVEFEVNNRFFFDPVGQDSFTAGEISIVGKLVNDLIYENVELKFSSEKSSKKCELISANGRPGIRFERWDNSTETKFFVSSGEAAQVLAKLTAGRMCGFETF